MPTEVRKQKIASLTDDEVLALKYDWKFHGRKEQFTPPDIVVEGKKQPWRTWLIMSGRGWGKTRTGAEWTKEAIRKSPYVNLIGATVTDARDIMIEGESGILAVCNKYERPTYVASKRQLQWPNGAKSLVFTADEPERLRGKQHGHLWADEVGAWRYEEAWDQAMFGLRLGSDPQVCVTTTPRPIKIIKDLIKLPTTVITRGTTYDNRTNLARGFFADIIRKYEGTRLGRQELMAELLDDNPGALWNLTQIDALRVREIPTLLLRIVVAVDPTVSKDGDKDECGIVVVGLGADQHLYVLDDLTISASPDGWAKQAVNAGYIGYQCDRLIAEVNNGGALVEATIRTVDPNVAYEAVHASRGKRTRAEPISAMYEQGRVHHVGTFSKLEDQMCEWDPLLSTESPDRMDALVWACTALINPTAGKLSFASLQ